MRLATGITGFDRMLGGGLPETASVVLQGPPGQEKLLLALTFLAEGLKEGASGLLVLSSQSAESILSELRKLGVDLDTVAKESRLRIVDWYSWSEETVHDVEEHGIILRSSVDLSSAGAALSRAIASLGGDKPKRAVVEILSPATNVFELSQVYAFAQSSKRKFDRFGFTSLFIVEKEMHAPAALSTLHQPFDGVIEMERVRSEDRIVRKIGILHLKDTTPETTFLPLVMTDKGFRVIDTNAPAPARPAGEGSPPAGPGLVHLVRRHPTRQPLVEGEALASRTLRVHLIMDIARERLNQDPTDADALFALAAAQATLGDIRAALESLRRLADIDERYPGLWVLKAKLHARVGEEEEWRQSRMKADQFSEPSAEPAPDLVPCPVCQKPMAREASLCPHCGSSTDIELDIIDELEKLTQDFALTPEESAAEEAAVPEALAELEAAIEPAPEEPVEKPAEKPVEAAVARPPIKEAPKRPEKAPVPKGLTNGNVLGRLAPRRSAPSGGVRGRTNGLRGRTNGLTNGLGRTNGLTNGLGRTNGLTNGLGRTNGLTNGLRGRTNGLTNGLGRTNGLTNGLGRTNGLKGRSTKRFLGIPVRAGWQRMAIPLVVVALLILPLFFLFGEAPPRYAIQIDGQFGDWVGVSKIPAVSPPALNPDIDIMRVAVKDNVDFLSFYLDVRGNVLAGGPVGQQTTNAFYAFIDTDRSRSTGYQVQGIGADRMISINTWGGQIVSTALKQFDSSHGSRNWNGWVNIGSLDAAASGNRMEFQVPWMDIAVPHGYVEVAFASQSWDGQSDAANVVVTDAEPFLYVTQAIAAPSVIASSATDLSRFTLQAVDGGVTVTGLNVTFEGTFSASSVSAVDLVDESGTTLAEGPIGKTVHFDLPSFVVAKNQSRTLIARLKVSGMDGSTIGALILNVDDVAVSSGGVAFSTPVTKPKSLAYIGSMPTGPRVDGAFGEWQNITSSPSGNVQPVWDRDIDLLGYEFMGAANDTFFMAQAAGTFLNGTMIPALNPIYSPPSTNGTGNASSSPPSVPPPLNGTDYLRIYLDTDGSASTGYRIGGIGADYLLEVAGKDGLILSSVAMRFHGLNPYQWNWTSLGAAPAAKDQSRIEAALPGVAITNVSRAFFEISGWNGAYDSSIPARPASVTTIPGLLYAPGAIAGIDPTGIIDTSTALSATGGPTERNIFYDGTTFWAFYYDGTTIQYEPSANGLSWVNAKNTAFSATLIPTVSTWFNLSGSTKNVYIIGDSGTNTKTADVRQGTISGTTITWAAADASVSLSNAQPGVGVTKVPVIIKDSNGYLWAAAFDQEKQTPALYNFAVARSTNPNSVASWNAYQVMNMTNSSSPLIQGVLVPLPTSGQVYAIWYLNGPIYGRLYTGTAWSGTIDTIATTTSGNLTLGPSAVVDGSGNIDLVYVDSTGAVQFKQRQGSSWGSATALDASSGNWYPTITWNNSTGNLYAFWLSSSGQIKGKVYSGASWTSATLEVNTKAKVGLTSVYNVGPTSSISWAWTQKYCQAGSTTCYDVKFSLYNSTLNSRTIDTTTATSALSYNNQRKVFFDGSYFWTFYYDGTNTVYTYSDGSASTWENAVAQAFTTANVGNPSVWFYSSGSTKIVYIVGDVVSGPAKGTVNVRRGVISGTTITWGTETAVSVSQNLLAKVPYITRDANGNLWIVSNMLHTGGGANLNICAIKSNNPDNVSAWSSCPAASGGLLPADILNNFIYPTILPLSGGDMYALWYADGTIAGRKYSNSTGWATNETIATTTAGVTKKIPSAVVDGSGNIDVVYIDTSGAVQFKQRMSSWSAATALDSSSGSTTPTLTLESGVNYLDVFYVSSTNQIKGQYYNGAWSAIIGYIDTSTTNKTYLTSPYSVSARWQVAWMWGSGTTSPFEVRIAHIPEFEQIAPPILGTVGLVLFLSARRRRARGRPGGISLPEVATVEATPSSENGRVR